MTIHFIHPHKAFLPEINAYVDFFTAQGIQTAVVRPEDVHGLPTEVEWHFMGQQTRRKKKVLTIHEYASASVPPFSTWKDRLKKWINAQPDYRIFNNDYVAKQFRFNDRIPFGIRNYGVQSAAEPDPVAAQKKYDFVYIGSIDKGRKLEPLFECFTTGHLKDHTLLVLTGNYEALAHELSYAANICFRGPVPFNDIYTHIRQARFGINFMPDIIPYNQQTSAKFLDYAACHLPIITTDYAWIRDFQNRFGGTYFFVNPDLSNLSWKNVNDFQYTPPDLRTWTWEKQIQGSGILDFLHTHFPDVVFPRF